MLIKLNIKLISWTIFLIAAASVITYIAINLPTSPSPTPLPSDVAHALEYFSASNSNKTIIVPSEYYSQAMIYSINNNKIISNDSEYANILLKNRKYPGIDFALIDMNTLNYLPQVYSNAGLLFNYSITAFPAEYTIENLSNSAKNCINYANSTDAFAQCYLFILGSKIGPLALATFPGNSTVDTVNASVFYNGTAMRYVPTAILPNSTNFKTGVMFVYIGLTPLYLPPQLMKTFYGSEMFLPTTIAKNVLDSFGEARVVSLG